MDAAVWDQWAQQLLGLVRLPLVSRVMGSAVAETSMPGGGVTGGYDSIWVAFTVTLTAEPGPLFAGMPDSQRWQEAWLFQRMSRMTTHASGAIAVCRVCGAPVEHEALGRCAYCHSDITTVTGGWVVTCLATTMRMGRRPHGDARTTPLRDSIAATLAARAAEPFTPPVQPPRAE
jgi:hypothetical protein